MTRQQWTKQTEPRPLWGSTPCACMGGWIPTKYTSEVPSSGGTHSRGTWDETETGHALNSVDWEALTAELMFECGFERASCNPSRKKKMVTLSSGLLKSYLEQLHCDSWFYLCLWPGFGAEAWGIVFLVLILACLSGLLLNKLGDTWTNEDAGGRLQHIYFTVSF